MGAMILFFMFQVELNHFPIIYFAPEASRDACRVTHSPTVCRDSVCVCARFVRANIEGHVGKYRFSGPGINSAMWHKTFRLLLRRYCSLQRGKSILGD